MSSRRPRAALRRAALTARPALAALLGLGVVVGLGAAPALGDSTDVPGWLTTNATPGVPGTAGTDGSAGAVSGPPLARQVGPLTVPVPPGTAPKAVAGIITMPQVVAGSSVVVLVEGREVVRVPSTLYRRVWVPVTAADAADGSIALSVRYDAPAGSLCDPGPGVTLRSLTLRYTGAETPPVTVETYWPAAVPRVDVRVAPDAPDDVLEAALDAVTALGHRYGVATPVGLVPADAPLPPAGAGRRVVDVVAGPPGAVTTIGSVEGTAALVLTGSGPALAEVARALAGRPAGRPAATPSPTRTLEEIEADTVGAPPDPAGSQLVEVRQDGFGSAVESYGVRLVGRHGAVPPGTRLEVHVDDTLVASDDLADAAVDPGIDLSFTVPAGVLRPANQLRATLVPPAGADPTCAGLAPLELVLDPVASTVSAARGVGDLRGFGLLPQVWGDRLDVALAGDARADAAVDAAALLLALQRLAVAPLDVSLVDPAVLVDRRGSGILVGADAASTEAAGAPRDLAGEVRTAALQAVVRDGHHLLVLGSWQPGDMPAAAALSHRLTARVLDDGWAGLEGDVLVADPSGPPYGEDSGRPAGGLTVEDPGPSATTGSAVGTTADSGSRRVVWLGASVGVLVIALALQLGRSVRQRTARVRRGRPPRP